MTNTKTKSVGLQNRGLVIFFVFLAASASVMALAVSGTYATAVKTVLPLESTRHGLGSSGLSFVGWSMPSNVMFSTSFVTSQQVSGFISGVLNVFPYQVQQGTVLTLGLYVNGSLVATQTYSMDNGSRPAAPLNEPTNDVANFTHTLASYTVVLLGMNTPLPSGTTITVTALVTNPIWVEIDDGMSFHSYQSTPAASLSLPNELVPETGVAAPHTLSVEVQFNAP